MIFPEGWDEVWGIHSITGTFVHLTQSGEVEEISIGDRSGSRPLTSASNFIITEASQTLIAFYSSCTYVILARTSERATSVQTSVQRTTNRSFSKDNLPTRDDRHDPNYVLYSEVPLYSQGDPSLTTELCQTS